MHEPRFYRRWITTSDLFSYNVTNKQSDLYILADANIRSKAVKSLSKHRTTIENYIENHPLFLSTLKPYPIDHKAPALISSMIAASAAAGVGPMAAVAGAIAEAVGQDLIPYASEIIIENGGDDFLKLKRKRSIAIYAGDSPLSGRIAMEMWPEETPIGICTSSGTVGHSLSFGTADAVVVTSKSASFADAAATAICNKVKSVDDIGDAIKFAQSMPNINGIVIIKEDRVGIWGKIRIKRN
jgi:hypothetical protein